MKLVASLIVRNELDRYLEPCVGHLLDFCDEIRVLNDGSTDGSDKWLVERDDRIKVADLAETTFFEHEGQARQVLLEWTLAARPTHVLAIDADEFVTDGQAVRFACRSGLSTAWSLCMEEVWKASAGRLELRQDGGWNEHDVISVWRVDSFPFPRIAPRALACGRIPVTVRGGRGVDAAILHFGWANEGDRVARHDRYVVADGGRFHQKAHLDSILLPDDEIELTERGWPAALDGVRDQILARANREQGEP